MKTRILSGLIMLPLLAVLYFGGHVLTVFCFAIGLVGAYEFLKGFRAMGYDPSYTIVAVGTLLLYTIHVLSLDKELYMLLAVLMVVAPSVYLFRSPESKLDDALSTIVAYFYVVIFSYHVVLIDGTLQRILVWLVVITAFGTDIFAYFGGYFFGKKKLCPTISPKKTIQGSYFGILGSMAIAALFGYILCREYVLHCLVLGLLGGIVSQFGDLTASVYKRRMGIKDYGNLIPGHGGILDRFDSVLYTAPLVYYYIVLLLN